MATPIRDFAATGAEERDILPRLALIWICDQWVFAEWVFGASGGFLFALDVDAGREVWRRSPGSKRGQISLRVDERQAVVMKAERALSDSGLETSVVIHHIESSGAKNQSAPAELRRVLRSPTRSDQRRRVCRPRPAKV